MAVAAERAGLNAALAAGFSVSSRGLGITVERPGRCAGTVVNPASRVRVSVHGLVCFTGIYGVSAAVAVHSAMNVRSYAPLASSSVVIVSVEKRGAAGVVPVVVMNYASVMPIASPTIPPPSITSEKADPETDSE